MRIGFSATRQLALWLLPATAFFIGACVKMPRHTLVSGGETTQVVARQESSSAPLININTASADELEKLPGVGKALAARIVSYRSEQGRFRRAEHLLMVRGISERRFRAMRALITVE